MINTTYHAVLFDLDGTLIDSATAFCLLLNRLRQAKKLPPLTLEKARIATARGANALVAVGLNMDLNDPEFIDHKTEFLSAYRNHLESHTCELFPGIEQVLTLLNEKSVPWGIVTNKLEEFTQLILANNPLLASAHTVVSGNTLPYNKPRPEPLLLASTTLHHSPEHIIYIGDHHDDIRAGQSAGMATGVALYGYLIPNELPETWGATYVFATPSKISCWLAKLVI